MINSNPIHRLILIALPFETCATLIPAEKISSLRERIKCQIFTNERARLACEQLSEAWKWSFEWMLLRWSRYSPVKEWTKRQFHGRRRQRRPCVNNYTRVSFNLGPPPTLCKYSNGTANGAPLFDSILVAVKVAQPREREREENPSSPDPSNAENYGLNQSPNNNKPGFLPFSFHLSSFPPRESHSSRECCFSRLAPFFRGGRWLHLRICTKSVGGQFLPTLNYVVRPQDLYGYSIYDILLFSGLPFQHCIDEATLTLCNCVGKKIGKLLRDHFFTIISTKWHFDPLRLLCF